MNVTRVTCVSAVAIGLGLAGLTSGSAVAAAEPGPPCGFGTCQGPGGGPGDRHDGPQWGGPGGGPDRGHDNGPGGPHWDGPGGPPWGPPQDPPPPPPPDLGWRGIDQGRFDHQPFNYNGSWVTPVFNPDVNNWGFWFLGIWIPL